MFTKAQPPSAFVALAGHPLRWNLLTELARSDRHVNELTQLVEQPQALVSYHLRQLRDAGLVTARRSSFDGRASYYTIDLERCGAALCATGVSLHPALALQVQPAEIARTRRPTQVLFACTGNGARSQIAEALLQHRAGAGVHVVSGGSEPKPVHPNAVRVLAERGIDISDRASKSLTQFTGRHFDVVVTLCDKVREACPELSTRPEAIHWSIEDPSRAGSDHRRTYPLFRRLAEELDQRVGHLIAVINHHVKESVTHARS